MKVGLKDLGMAPLVTVLIVVSVGCCFSRFEFASKLLYYIKFKLQALTSGFWGFGDPAAQADSAP